MLAYQCGFNEEGMGQHLARLAEARAAHIEVRSVFGGEHSVVLWRGKAPAGPPSHTC